MIIIQSKKAIMAARWVSKEEYEAIVNGTAPAPTNQNGINATTTMSGKALESKASPHALEQKDFQGTQIVHDIMTRSGLNETETSDKTINYAVVNSTLTEKAPSISTTYQQEDGYSETYQTRTETIQAETLTRTTNSNQYTKTQNNLNLNAPTTLNRTATEKMTRTITNRNASIGTHTMNGQNYSLAGNTIQRFGGITVIKAKHVQFKANNFNLSSGTSNEAKPVQPRRAPPDIIAKVSGTFASKTVSLPTAYNADYMMPVDFTVTGDYEMESVNSLNPQTITPENIEADVQKTLGDYFYQMKVVSATHMKELNQVQSPSFVIGNKYKNYTLTDGIVFVADAINHVYICSYTTAFSEEKRLINGWLLTLSSSLESRITVGRKTISDKIEIQANNMIQKANTFLQKNQNDPYYGPTIRLMQTWIRPEIQAMYDAIDFLYSLNIGEIAPLTIL